MEPVIEPLDISSRQELVTYLVELSRQVHSGEFSEIENESLPSYIEAASAWIDDMDGFFKFHGKEPPENPTWGVIGAIFQAALVYE